MEIYNDISHELELCPGYVLKNGREIDPELEFSNFNKLRSKNSQGINIEWTNSEFFNIDLSYIFKDKRIRYITLIPVSNFKDYNIPNWIRFYPDSKIFNEYKYIKYHEIEIKYSHLGPIRGG